MGDGAMCELVVDDHSELRHLSGAEDLFSILETWEECVNGAGGGGGSSAAAPLLSLSSANQRVARRGAAIRLCSRKLDSAAPRPLRLLLRLVLLRAAWERTEGWGGRGRRGRAPLGLESGGEVTGGRGSTPCRSFGRSFYGCRLHRCAALGPAADDGRPTSLYSSW